MCACASAVTGEAPQISSSWRHRPMAAALHAYAELARMQSAVTFRSDVVPAVVVRAPAEEPSRQSLASRAVRGALWTVISSIGGRAIGVVGTLVMTRFLHPEQIGEVSDATIIAMTANWLTIWGFGQYSVVKGRGDAAVEVTWHATVAYAVLGTLSLGLVALFGGRLTPFLDAPNAAAYVPGMALALYIRRFTAIPERVLTRQMKFRASGIAAVAGELSYTAVALTLAALGHGGWSIVIANIVQSCVMLAVLVH